jgi:hypothetical protein
VSLLLGLLGEARAEIEQLGSRVASERSRWAGEIERLADARAADVGVMTSLRESLAFENRTSAEMREQLSVSLNECSDARASLETSESERGEIRAALNSRDLALAETTQYVTRLESERDALSQRLVEMDAALGARSDELEASTNRIALLEATKDELEQAIELERRAMEAEASLKEMAIKQSQARAEAEAAADAARAEAEAKARAEVQASAEAARAEADAKARAEVQAAAEAARAEAEAKARAEVQAATEAARAEAEAKAHAEAEAAAERIRVLELDSALLTRQRDEATSRVEDMTSETDALLSAQSEANARAAQDMERLRCSLSSSESALADEKERLRAAEATAHCAAAAFDVERAAARKQQLEAAAEFDAAAERECSAAEREDGLRASQEVAMMTITDFEERRRQAEAEIAQQISARESAETKVAVIRSELETKLLVIATLEKERDAASAAAESARETLRDVENNMRAGQFSEDDLDLDVDIDLEDGDGEVDEKTGKREETVVTQSCSAESELVLRLCAERDEARAERDAAHFAGKQWRDMLDEIGRDDDFHQPLSSCASAPAPTAVSAEQEGAAVCLFPGDAANGATAGQPQLLPRALHDGPHDDHDHDRRRAELPAGLEHSPRLRRQSDSSMRHKSKSIAEQATRALALLEAALESEAKSEATMEPAELESHADVWFGPNSNTAEACGLGNGSGGSDTGSSASEFSVVASPPTVPAAPPPVATVAGPTMVVPEALPADEKGKESQENGDARVQTPVQTRMRSPSAPSASPVLSVPSASPGREAMDQLRVALSAMEKQRHEYEELLALQSEMLEHHDEALLLVEQHGALDLDRGIANQSFGGDCGGEGRRRGFGHPTSSPPPPMSAMRPPLEALETTESVGAVPSAPSAQRGKDTATLPSVRPGVMCNADGAEPGATSMPTRTALSTSSTKATSSAVADVPLVAHESAPENGRDCTPVPRNVVADAPPETSGAAVGATAGASQLPHPRDIVGSGEIAPSPPISVHKPPSSESEADFFTTFGV